MLTLNRANRSGIKFIEHNVRFLTGLLARVALVLAPPLLRIALATPFFRSGLTKWTDFFSLSPAAVFLFEDEFKLHILGQTYEFPTPTVFAWFVRFADIVLPVL